MCFMRNLEFTPLHPRDLPDGGPATHYLATPIQENLRRLCCDPPRAARGRAETGRTRPAEGPLLVGILRKIRHQPDLAPP